MQRSERLIRLTKRLLDSPNRPMPLSELSVNLEAAKSSISEDVTAIRQALEAEQTGTIESLTGAAGGVLYRVALAPAAKLRFRDAMQQRLADPSRVLPGGFLYMSDVLGDPDVLDTVGRLFAERFASAGANVVVTVETKGIPLAVATARYLHVPVVVVRREHRVTDGAALSVHYVSGSERRIQTMSISTRAMPPQARAIIVDDFMRAGATVKAVAHLLSEFSAEVAGTGVFMAMADPHEKLVSDYLSLFVLEQLQEGQAVRIRANSFLG